MSPDPRSILLLVMTYPIEQLIPNEYADGRS